MKLLILPRSVVNSYNFPHNVVLQVSFDRNSEEKQNAVTQAIEDEVSFLGRLQHPHVIKCLGATKHAAYVNIFLEWMPGKTCGG